MSGFTAQKYTRIYDDHNGVFLQIGVAADGPEFGIQISTAGYKPNEEWYGKQDLVIGKKEQAILIANAILELANGMDD